MATKQVQKSRSNNLKLYVLSHIKDTNSLPIEIPKPKLSYHLKPLKMAKYIQKKGYGVWEITKLGLAVIQKKELQILSLGTSFVSGKTKRKNIIRGHGFMWSLKLPNRAFLDAAARTRLSQKRGCTTLKNGAIKTELRGHNVHLCLRSVLVYFNKDLSYLGKSASESYREALYELEKVISMLESLYGKSLRIRKIYKFKVCKNHYGDLNNEFAVHYKKGNQFVRVFDEGKEWLIMDFSDKKYIELETTASDRAKYDMDIVIAPTMNKLRHNPLLLDELDKRNKELEQSVNRLMSMLDKQQTTIESQQRLIEKAISVNTFR